MVIKFKSNYKAPAALLSNFYGGSEFTFMSQRTKNETLKKLYLDLRDNMTYDQYQNYRERLMDPKPPVTRPRKKIFTKKYKDPYVKQYTYDKYNEETNTYSKVTETFYGFGVIAKLISACWKSTMNKRLFEVNWIAKSRFGDEATPIKKEDFLPNTQQQNTDYMLNALRLKFQKEPYKSYLKSTAGEKIYEAGSSREGSNNIWTGEDGLLGKLLTVVRGELLWSHVMDLLSEDDEDDEDELPEEDHSVLGKRKKLQFKF